MGTRMKLTEFFALEDRLPGGKGDDLDVVDVDPHELRLGMQHEMEHTDDPRVASEIARDHLAEDPHYYSDMAAAGRLFRSED